MCLNNIRIANTFDNNMLDNYPSKINFSDTCDYVDYEDIEKLKCLKGNVNIMQINVQGIISKQGQLNDLLNKYCSKFEIHIVNSKLHLHWQRKIK